MLKRVKVGPRRWVAGTRDRWTGSRSVGRVNISKKPIPAKIKKSKKLKEL